MGGGITIKHWLVFTFSDLVFFGVSVYQFPLSVIATFVADLWNSKWHTVLALAVGFQVFRFFVLFHSDW